MSGTRLSFRSSIQSNIKDTFIPLRLSTEHILGVQSLPLDELAQPRRTRDINPPTSLEIRMSNSHIALNIHGKYNGKKVEDEKVMTSALVIQLQNFLKKVRIRRLFRIPKKHQKTWFSTLRT